MKNPKELMHSLLTKMTNEGMSGRQEILKEPITVFLNGAGSLPTRIGSDNKKRIACLKLAGKFNSTDVKFLRTMPRLEVLDLSEAKIVAGGSYYIEQWYCQTEDDVMGTYMFYRNKTLRSIVFPKDVSVVRPLAFRRCESLAEIKFSESLEQIEERAFSYCNSLVKVQFPAALKNIRPRAFAHCRALETVVLSDSMDTIGDFSFGDCAALTSVDFGTSVARIEANAFAHTALSSVTLPSSLKHLGTAVFDGCRSLKAIHVTSVVPPNAMTDTFEGIDLENCTLFVPKGSKKDYWLVNGWEKFKHIVEE